MQRTTHLKGELGGNSGATRRRNLASALANNFDHATSGFKSHLDGLGLLELEAWEHIQSDLSSFGSES